ncbi:surfeit locus 1 family protein [Dioscorea alata]|uniref:Surfeit locus 1 family protein n=1 Tax=Dioscorea alata TaxID=55571 RepID=A0ACB7U0Z1_DIOAL|nr:surfeit locus 1 family protein [Dioscorea alata]
MAASLFKTLKLHRPFLSSIARNPAPCSPFSPFSSASSQPLASESQDKERGGWAKLFLFLPGAITFGLGTWQLFRRQEKMEMLDYRKKRLEMEPILWNKLKSCSGSDLDDSLEFRKVLCEGVFDEEKSVYIGPRSRSISGVTENGYYVITPLFPTPNQSDSVQLPVLVNRGWVPRGWRDKDAHNSQDFEKAKMDKKSDFENIEEAPWWKFWSKKHTVSKNEEPVVTPIRVIGVVRGSEKPSIFVPANDPDSGQWFYVDVPMIACASGLPEDTLYIEDINENVNPTHPYPLPKDVNSLINHSVMPRDHLNYVITWYSLSAAVTYMAVKRIRLKKTRQ